MKKMMLELLMIVSFGAVEARIINYDTASTQDKKIVEALGNFCTDSRVAHVTYDTSSGTITYVFLEPWRPMSDFGMVTMDTFNDTKCDPHSIQRKDAAYLHCTVKGKIVELKYKVLDNEDFRDRGNPRDSREREIVFRECEETCRYRGADQDPRKCVIACINRDPRERETSREDERRECRDACYGPDANQNEKCRMACDA